MDSSSTHRGLHFIALIPDDSLRSGIRRYKEIASERFNSSHAFNAPGHITLFPPFHMKDQSEEVLARLEQVAENTVPFEVYLNGFGHFGNSVIFIDVEENEYLQSCHDRLKSSLIRDEVLPYRGHEEFYPHITIATRDLEPNVFPEAWAFFRKEEFGQSFEARNLFLMIHQEKLWEIRARFPLEGR